MERAKVLLEQGKSSIGDICDYVGISNPSSVSYTHLDVYKRQLLVSVRLAAQCTDARVNVVVQDLYKKYPSVEALANADVADIEAIVKPCGLGHSKARDISGCMRMLRDEYGGKIPKDFNALLKLPGVGRKSANLIMGDVFGEPAIVTDTHCIRLTNRMGLVLSLIHS